MDQKQAQLDLLYFCISAKNHHGTHAQAMDGHISSFKGFYGLELLNVVYKVLKEDAARAKGLKASAKAGGPREMVVENRCGLKCAHFAFLKAAFWPSSSMYTRHTRELESKAIKKAILPSKKANHADHSRCSFAAAAADGMAASHSGREMHILFNERGL